MYQIQGQLEIANKDFCYFFIYTFMDYHCEIIRRDKKFWNNIFPRFKKFYFSAFLPEMVDSRVQRNLPSGT